MAVLDLLRETRLFAKCRDEDLDALRAVAVPRQFADGTLLFSLGDEADELMVVSSGAVQLELPVSVLGQTQSIAFETVGRGSIVGWSSLAPGGRFTLSGRASGETNAMAFPRRDLQDLFEVVPAFGRDVLRNALLIATWRLRRSHRMWIREIERGVDQRYR